MTELQRKRDEKFAKAIQSEYEAERIKTQSRYKHLVQERMGVKDMKDAADKPIMGEVTPKTAEEVAVEGEALLADDTSEADERLKRPAPPNWTYEEIEALVNEPGNPVPFADRLPYEAIAKLKADPPKTKKFYREYFARRMGQVIAAAEDLLGEDAARLPEVDLTEDRAAPAAPQLDTAPEEEEDEWAGLSPAQRAIQETRANVDAAFNAYRYVRSYTSLSEGLSYFVDDKIYPEKLGPAASKIEAVDARARMKKVGNISYKGIIDMPVWKSDRQLREEAEEAKRNPQLAQQQKQPVDAAKSKEAEELVELFMAGKLF